MSAASAHRLTAMLVLLAHLLGATSLLPAVVASAADVEGGHTVLVIYSKEGPTVTLSHQGCEFTAKPGDHKTVPGRLLATLCESVGSGDHVLDGAVMSSTVVEFKKRLGEIGFKAVRAPVFEHRLSLVAMRTAIKASRVARPTSLPSFHLRSLAVVQIVT